MSELTPAFQAAPETPVPTPADVAPASAKPEPAAAAPATDKPNIDGWMDGKTPELTVENASKVIAAIREDFKAERQKLREGEAAKQAVADAETALAQKIGKALGLVKDEPVDPAKLTEQLTASQVEAKRARVELAVFRNAEAAGADPQALLDSASFLAKVRDIDPSDPAAVSAAISEAVASNPRLGAAPTSRVPAPNPAQGSSGSGATGVSQVTEAELDQMTAEQIEAARKEGRLNNLLGIKN